MPGSLDILAPSVSVRSYTADGVGLELEKLSVAILNLINTRDFDTNPVLDYISPAFTSEFKYATMATSKEQFIANMKDVIRTDPDYHLEIISVSSDLDQVKRTAKVWVAHRGHKYPSDGLERESVKVLKWSKGKHGWRCLGYSGLNASGLLW